MKAQIPHLEERVRRDARGRVIWRAWYWVPSKRLRREGYSVLALGKDRSEAQALAIRQNADVTRARRAGQAEAGTIAALIRAYRADDEFPSKPATVRSYNQNLDWIERWAGDKPVQAISRKVVKELKRTLTGTPYRANAIIGMIRILYGFAMREGLVEFNPASQFRRVTVAPRHQVWMPQDEAAFASAAGSAGRQSLWLAVALGLYTAQRQTDILAMQWSQCHSGCLSVRQSKTGELVEIPILGPLPELLSTAPRNSTYIVVSEATHRPYRADHFRHEVSAIMKEAGLSDLQFRDLRRTSVVRMHHAGLSAEEISGVTGHKIEQTREILETYLPRSRRITAESVQKLSDYYEKSV